ncbi:MAG TPA: GNAT family N-acetyltransferase [bacterium]|jgi:RimJ/RimL family protein N-acetyltransferase|nr:GNAT family N-acetyltransferase [bacterium]HPW39440.1 GNAT family N-acetyltransferase [bacterium]HQA63622.1 GNAT family N-acetyltransferase [bacterium]
MTGILLRKISTKDKKYFTEWWRNADLIKLTSGCLDPISDKDVDKYFSLMIDSKVDHHFMIIIDKKVIGHIVLSQRKNGWYETQIIIGDKNFWGRGYGTEAIKKLLRKAKNMGISKVYLEVRPTNIRAITAYKKSGFLEKGIIKYPDNPYLPETLRMEINQ